MSFAIPLLLMLFVLLFVLMYFLFKPEISRVEGGTAYVAEERRKLGKWKRGEINALLAFLVTVTLWLIPGVLAVMYGEDSAIAKSYSKTMPEGVAALIGATFFSCCQLTGRTRVTVTWKQATRSTGEPCSSSAAVLRSAL